MKETNPKEELDYYDILDMLCKKGLSDEEIIRAVDNSPHKGFKRDGEIIEDIQRWKREETQRRL